ncbi:MAG: family 20 glycosylhydrolase [Acidobacteria bacterium]|nr:family 20 glycosylhydrolase [Acidobacteriota bacterium]
MRTCWLVLLIIPFLVAVTSADNPPALHLMPWPQSVTIEPHSELLVQSSFTVGVASSDPRLRRAVQIFLRDLRRHTGSTALDFSIASGDSTAQLRIESDRPSKEVVEFGEDESYRLEVTSSGAQLKAPTTLGVMRGLQTLLELVEITPHGFAVPAVTIADKPRFPWRGLMIDSGRHFIPVDVIERNLDGMAAVKLNVFHWHLSDNQGFRVETKRFPKLAEMGSDGLYYTQDEVRGVISYARDRGIRVVPEFDMPGHSTAWFVGYPDLASAPGPYSIERKWGIFDPAMDPTRESTYKFLDEFIGEMAKLFPDQFFHIGGDEVNGKQWDANPNIQEFMRSHQLKNNADLQAYFNTRIQKILEKHGKIMEGWDEILRPALPKSIVIQSWRGPQSLADAAHQGYRGLLSSGYYLDLMQPAREHYAVDPFSGGAGSLTEEEKQKILGGEACMWAEYVSPETIDSRIWPRAAAIAERLWSGREVTDVQSMYARMDYLSKWLDAYGLTHNTNYPLMLERMTDGGDISALRTLADLLEPVKGYTREGLAVSEPTSLTPLNRVVDAARPESTEARRFGQFVDQFISGHPGPGTEIAIRSRLLAWRDNDLELQPLLKSSALAEEVAPLSHDLSLLAAAGLEALDYLDRGDKAPEDWKARQLELAERAIQPRAQLLLMVAGPVERLIQMSAGEVPKDLPQPKNAGE